MNTAIEISNKITNLQHESNELLKKLTVSMFIEKIWGECVFPVKSTIYHKTWTRPEQLLYKLRDSKGKEKILNVKDLPKNIQENLSCYNKIKHLL